MRRGDVVGGGDGGWGAVIVGFYTGRDDFDWW